MSDFRTLRRGSPVSGCRCLNGVLFNEVPDLLLQENLNIIYYHHRGYLNDEKVDNIYIYISYV